jgi:ElaB/YqjD/DUF883 family membrane-anchored ribosome-binding protein
MTNATKSLPDAEASGDLQAIMSDVAAVKRDLAALVRGMKTDVSEDVACARSAVGDLGDEVVRVYENLSAQGDRSVKAVGRQVGEQPLMSLLVAFAVGVLGSRLLSR